MSVSKLIRGWPVVGKPGCEPTVRGSQSILRTEQLSCGELLQMDSRHTGIGVGKNGSGKYCSSRHPADVQFMAAESIPWYKAHRS